jgi:hypothetical protein
MLTSILPPSKCPGEGGHGCLSHVFRISQLKPSVVDYCTTFQCTLTCKWQKTSTMHQWHQRWCSIIVVWWRSGIRLYHRWSSRLVFPKRQLPLRCFEVRLVAYNLYLLVFVSWDVMSWCLVVVNQALRVWDVFGCLCVDAESDAHDTQIPWTRLCGCEQISRRAWLTGEANQTCP